MATIREVAVKAGVAPSSVTRVLSGHPNVSVDLRDRVLAAVREVGYKPDLVAAGLRRGYTKTVGFIVNDILNPVIAQMIDVVESELRQAGYAVLLANSHGQSTNDVENVRLLQQRRVDALLASFSDDTNSDLAPALSAVPIPVVLLDREIEPQEFNGVVSDHRMGAALLGEHLLSRGHREIAIISGSLTAYPSRSRVSGLTEVLAKHGVTLRPEFCIAGRGSEEFGTQAVARLLDDPRPPTAIVIGNGNTGAIVGVMAGIAQRAGYASARTSRWRVETTARCCPCTHRVSPPSPATSRISRGARRPWYCNGWNTSAPAPTPSSCRPAWSFGPRRSARYLRRPARPSRSLAGETWALRGLPL